MDPHSPDHLQHQINPALNGESLGSPASTGPNGEYLPGTVLVYGVHGKCQVCSVESRVTSGHTVRYYKLEIVKSSLSRSTKQSPAIWVPVDKAKDQGLREPLSSDQAETVMRILESREYYFDIKLAWPTAQTVLEDSIRAEGAIGLAKSMSYLNVLKKKLIVFHPDITRFAENVQKQLFRELSEATHTPLRTIEDRVFRGMRHKLLPDH